jgi:hypothetical protein
LFFFKKSRKSAREVEFVDHRLSRGRSPTDKGHPIKNTLLRKRSWKALNSLLLPTTKFIKRILTMSIPLLDLSNPNIEELAAQVKDACSVIQLITNNCSHVRHGDSCTSKTLEFQVQQ